MGNKQKLGAKTSASFGSMHSLGPASATFSFSADELLKLKENEPLFSEGSRWNKEQFVNPVDNESVGMVVDGTPLETHFL